jgi:hypothetical protein
MSDKHCVTCRWWVDAWEDFRDLGICRMVKCDDDAPVLMLVDDRDVDWVFYTGKEFGCNQHRVK